MSLLLLFCTFLSFPLEAFLSHCLENKIIITKKIKFWWTLRKTIFQSNQYFKRSNLVQLLKLFHESPSLAVWNNTDVPVLTMMSSKTFQATILIISFIAKISKNKKGTINTFDILVWNIVAEYVCMHNFLKVHYVAKVSIM